VALLNSCSKESTERLILLNPKCNFVGSIKSYAVPFQHDALPDERVAIHTPESAITFFCKSPRPILRAVWAL
jgi:hypothetical protein